MKQCERILKKKKKKRRPQLDSNEKKANLCIKSDENIYK